MDDNLKLEGIKHFHRCTMKRLRGDTLDGRPLVIGIPCTVCSILDCPNGSPYHYSAEGGACSSCHGEAKMP